MTNAVGASALRDHQTIAVYLASQPGATYRDVAVQLHQDPHTILLWLTAALRERAEPPSGASRVVRGFGSVTGSRTGD